MNICPKCRLPLRNEFEFISHRLIEMANSMEEQGRYDEARTLRLDSPASYVVCEGEVVRRRPPLDD